MSREKIIQPLSPENGHQKAEGRERVPKSEIITTTGHLQEQSVEAYDSGNEDEQRKLSKLGCLTSLMGKKSTLKEQCHEDFAVLGQFCAKVITLRL